MKTVVIFKWCNDPQDARVSADGHVSWDGVKLSASDDDPAAMEIGNALVGDDELVGLTLEGGKADFAAARGACKTVVIDGTPEDASDVVKARALAAAVQRIGDVDAVVMGDSGWNCGLTTAFIGASGLPAYTGVIEAGENAGKVVLKVKDQGGVREIEADAPVVLLAKALGDEENPPGMKQTLAARKKPVENYAFSELGVEEANALLSVETYLPENDSAILFDDPDSKVAARQLLEALHADDVL